MILTGSRQPMNENVRVSRSPSGDITTVDVGRVHIHMRQRGKQSPASSPSSIGEPPAPTDSPPVLDIDASVAYNIRDTVAPDGKQQQGLPTESGAIADQVTNGSIPLQVSPIKSVATPDRPKSVQGAGSDFSPADEVEKLKAELNNVITQLACEKLTPRMTRNIRTSAIKYGFGTPARPQWSARKLSVQSQESHNLVAQYSPEQSSADTEGSIIRLWKRRSEMAQRAESQAKQELACLAAEAASLRNEREQIVADAEAFRAEAARHSRDIHTSQHEQESLETEIVEARDTINQLQRKLVEQLKRRAESDLAVDLSAQNLEQANARLKEFEMHLNESTQRAAHLREKQQQTQASLLEACAKVQDLEPRLAQEIQAGKLSQQKQVIELRAAREENHHLAAGVAELESCVDELRQVETARAEVANESQREVEKAMGELTAHCSALGTQLAHEKRSGELLLAEIQRLEDSCHRSNAKNASRSAAEIAAVQSFAEARAQMGAMRQRLMSVEESEKCTGEKLMMLRSDLKMSRTALKEKGEAEATMRGKLVERRAEVTGLRQRVDRGKAKELEDFKRVQGLEASARILQARLDTQEEGRALAEQRLKSFETQNEELQSLVRELQLKAVNMEQQVLILTERSRELENRRKKAKGVKERQAQLVKARDQHSQAAAMKSVEELAMVKDVLFRADAQNRELDEALQVAQFQSTQDAALLLRREQESQEMIARLHAELDRLQGAESRLTRQCVEYEAELQKTKQFSLDAAKQAEESRNAEAALQARSAGETDATALAMRRAVAAEAKTSEVDEEKRTLEVKLVAAEKHRQLSESQAAACRTKARDTAQQRLEAEEERERALQRLSASTLELHQSQMRAQAAGDQTASLQLKLRASKALVEELQERIARETMEMAVTSTEESQLAHRAIADRAALRKQLAHVEAEAAGDAAKLQQALDEASSRGWRLTKELEERAASAEAMTSDLVELRLQAQEAARDAASGSQAQAAEMEAIRSENQRLRESLETAEGKHHKLQRILVQVLRHAPQSQSQSLPSPLHSSLLSASSAIIAKTPPRPGALTGALLGTPRSAGKCSPAQQAAAIYQTELEALAAQIETRLASPQARVSRKDL